MSELTRTRNTLALIADIGGTHIRLALTGASGEPRRVETLNCGDFPDLLSAVQSYLAGLPGQMTPGRGAFAIAGPVKNGRAALTNIGWTFSIEGMRGQIGLESLHVINDFAAIAHALPHLGHADHRRIGGGEPRPGAPAGVVGPGTGLGVSALVPCSHGYTALETEGGHVTLAALDAFEADVIAILRRRFGHVSAERALSGPGLVNLHDALVQLEDAAPESLTPEQVTKRGLAEPDSICGRAVELFCTMLGTVAADLALSVGAHGGIFIAGGIVAKLGDSFVGSGFRRRFESKGRFSAYLKEIPTSVITHPYPALVGLRGFLALGEPAGERRGD